MGSAYSLTGRSILVVEDEPLIALEMAALFDSAGARVLQARTIAEATDRAKGLSAAVLDYGLGKEGIQSLCALLLERSIPYMFYTGYGDVQMTYPEAVVVVKPATASALLSAVAGLVERRAALVS